MYRFSGGGWQRPRPENCVGPLCFPGTVISGAARWVCRAATRLDIACRQDSHGDEATMTKSRRGHPVRTNTAHHLAWYAGWWAARPATVARHRHESCFFVQDISHDASDGSVPQYEGLGPRMPFEARSSSPRTTQVATTARQCCWGCHWRPHVHMAGPSRLARIDGRLGQAPAQSTAISWVVGHRDSRRETGCGSETGWR